MEKPEQKKTVSKEGLNVAPAQERKKQKEKGRKSENLKKAKKKKRGKKR